MIIDVKQTIVEKKNEFEILYNNKKIYNASLPFLDILGSFDLEKFREIKVYDINNNLKYKTNYNYVDNIIEELIPLKYLATNSQKFYQLKFVDQSNNDEILIFFEMKINLYNYYAIKYKNVIYNCFSIEDGYIRHICVYKDNIQVAEILKPNLIIDGKDEYKIYLLDEYNYLSDSLSMLVLYLDRIEYNSSYLKVKGKQVYKAISYSKANEYYNPDWTKINFNSGEYINKINKEAEKSIKEVLKNFKQLILIIGIIFVLLIIITIILYFYYSILKRS